MTSFAEQLEIGLQLAIGGKKHVVPGGNVTALDLRLVTWGFEGKLELWVVDDSRHGGKRKDELLAAFLGNDLIEISLSIAPRLAGPRTPASLAPITLRGLVRTKRLEERATGVTSTSPVLARKYSIEFADPAQVLWRQHHPTELYSEKSMKQVLEAHTFAPIDLDLRWQALADSEPLLFIHLPPEAGASFYDFVLWYVDTHDGVFWYDHARGIYVIDAVKDASAKPLALFGDDVGSLACAFREVPRHDTHVLSSYTEAPANRVVSQPLSVQGVRHDHLIRTPIAQEVDDRVTLEQARLQAPLFDLELELGRFPSVDVRPGALYVLDAANLFSAELSVLTARWRAREWRIAARRLDERPDDALGEPVGKHGVTMRATFEQAHDRTKHLPPYRSPSYPAAVEGRIVSDPGEDGDKTYQVFTDEETSLQKYKIEVPLWGGQTVMVPFEPYQGSGNVYLPAYKKARVLLELGFDSARIAWLLDWREGVALPQEGQGENILFGKNANSKTRVSHAYQGDTPVFTVERTNDTDNAFITIEEGALTIKVWEKEA